MLRHLHDGFLRDMLANLAATKRASEREGSPAGAHTAEWLARLNEQSPHGERGVNYADT